MLRKPHEPGYTLQLRCCTLFTRRTKKATTTPPEHKFTVLSLRSRYSRLRAPPQPHAVSGLSWTIVESGLLASCFSKTLTACGGFIFGLFGELFSLHEFSGTRFRGQCPRRSGNMLSLSAG